MSSIQLSQDQINILGKGLKFTPTPKRNVHELKKDTENFTRKLRLIEFFADEEANDDNNISLVKKKGKFTPSRERNKTLDIIIDFLHKQNFEETKKNNTSNITKDENKGIMELKNNAEIIIKEADKGGAVVIMNREHYKKMVLDQLEDSKTYKTTKDNCDKQVLKKIKEHCEKFKSELTNDEIEYLTSFQMRTSNFYGLPKIHKSKLIKEAIERQKSSYIECLEPSDLKIRPIVAGPCCPTRNLSDLIDKIIKPLLQHVKSHVKDNLDFLKECSRENNENTSLLTCDIVSLYTNIPHKYGLEALNHWLDSHKESINDRFSKEFIIESADIVLTNNNFKFDDIFYNQIDGTAMGTIFAPTYADLTIGFLELELYRRIEQKWSREIKNIFVKNWKRYLDDCQMPIKTSQIDPNELLSVLNSINKSIQFTLEMDNQSIPFLDILIKRNSEKIWMDLYHKPTDTRRCVEFSSCHPNHCKRNIPFSLARRIHVICEDDTEKNRHLIELRENLTKQGYPRELIENAFRRAESIPKEDLRKPKIKEDNKNLVPFITTHNPNNPQVFSKVKAALNTLVSNETKGFHKDLKLIQSKRQGNNLKKILTKAEFTSKVQGVHKCGNKRCECCNCLLLGDSYTFKNTQRRFELKSYMSCDSSNLIYVIICPTCGEEYIGETGLNNTKLRDRVRVYRQHIRDPRYQVLKVEGHLRTCGGGKFKIFPFLQIRSNDTDLRKAYEANFIKNFKVKLNAF